MTHRLCANGCQTITTDLNRCEPVWASLNPIEPNGTDRIGPDWLEPVRTCNDPEIQFSRNWIVRFFT